MTRYAWITLSCVLAAALYWEECRRVGQVRTLQRESQTWKERAIWPDCSCSEEVEMAALYADTCRQFRSDLDSAAWRDRVRIQKGYGKRMVRVHDE